QAHFIWLAPVVDKDGTMNIEVRFSEDASPDDPELLGKIKNLKLYRVFGSKDPVVTKLTLANELLSTRVKQYQGKSLYIAAHDYGIIERGGSAFRLRYYAKTGPAITSTTWNKTDTSDDLRLDVVPTFDQGKVIITVRFDGQPVAESQVKASGPGLVDFEGVTNKKGRVEFRMAESGLYSIRVRHVELEAGELNGEKFSETRHYSTVAVKVPAPTAYIAYKQLSKISQPVTSFGAAILNSDLYVYGGHTGSAHSYAMTEQANQLLRMSLKSGKWTSLAKGPHLQGLAMVAHDQKIYRLGGFTAQNSEGEEHDLWSKKDVAVFDPIKQTWTELPQLPEPRSSFDAAMLGDTIYVVGGWSMQGAANKHWHETAWRMDLNQKSLKWEAISAPPFKRRAIAVAAHKGKLFVLGGMQETGGPTRKVSLFNPASNSWSEGPELVGEEGINGFGVSSFATGGQLYASTIKGELQRLNSDGSAWEIIGKTPTPRFFHRLLSIDKNHLLVVGGASMKTGKFDGIELLSVEP
nr:hypothetical protein [Planctomycetota bacterium]